MNGTADYADFTDRQIQMCAPTPAATGIDEAVLANYAYVARNVPRSMRRSVV